MEKNTPQERKESEKQNEPQERKEQAQRATEDMLQSFTRHIYNNDLTAFVDNLYKFFEEESKESPEALQQLQDFKKLLEPFRTATQRNSLNEALKQIDCATAEAMTKEPKFNLISDFTIALIGFEKQAALFKIKGELLQYIPREEAETENKSPVRFLSGYESDIIDEIIDSKGRAAKDSPNYEIIKKVIDDYNTAKTKSSFYNLPTSTANDLIYSLLGYGENLASFAARKKSVNHNTEIKTFKAGNSRKIELNNSKATISLEISDIEKIAGSNKATKKIFVLTLIKANEQALHNGKLTQNYITFSLNDLIDIGLYKTPQSARRGFKKAMDALQSLKIKGTLKKHTKKSNKGKEKNNSIDVSSVLFPNTAISKGQCIIYLNEFIDWKFLAQYFTLLPIYYFSLSNRASDLLYYIFYLARQKTKKIQRRGYFTISFRSLQVKLNLPSETGNREPQKTIKQPIEAAIEEIENAHSTYYNNTDFSLYPVCDDNAHIKGFLDNGYLKITLKGYFAQPFTELSQKQTKRIEDAEKRKNAVIDRAKAIAIVEKEKQKNE